MKPGRSTDGRSAANRPLPETKSVPQERQHIIHVRMAGLVTLLPRRSFINRIYASIERSEFRYFFARSHSMELLSAPLGEGDIAARRQFVFCTSSRQPRLLRVYFGIGEMARIVLVLIFL